MATASWEQPNSEIPPVIMGPQEGMSENPEMEAQNAKMVLQDLATKIAEGATVTPEMFDKNRERWEKDITEAAEYFKNQIVTKKLKFSWGDPDLMEKVASTTVLLERAIFNRFRGVVDERDMGQASHAPI